MLRGLKGLKTREVKEMNSYIDSKLNLVLKELEADNAVIIDIRYQVSSTQSNTFSSALIIYMEV